MAWPAKYVSTWYASRKFQQLLTLHPGIHHGRVSLSQIGGIWSDRTFPWWQLLVAMQRTVPAPVTS
jgi:hypothetical protein